MANTKQASKFAKQTKKRTSLRTSFISKSRTFLKKANLKLKDLKAQKQEVFDAIQQYQIVGAKCAGKNYINKDAFSRTLSKLTRAYKNRFNENKPAA